MQRLTGSHKTPLVVPVAGGSDKPEEECMFIYPYTYKNVEEAAKIRVHTPAHSSPLWQSAKPNESLYSIDEDDFVESKSTSVGEMPVKPQSKLYTKKENRGPQTKPRAYRERPVPDLLKEQRFGFGDLIGPVDDDGSSTRITLDWDAWRNEYLPKLDPPTSKKGKANKWTSDPYVGARKIPGLGGTNFQDYIKQKDITLVLFYNSSISAKGDLQEKVKRQFTQAAEITKRDNHAYAAMDCFQNIRFCKEERLKHFPALKLYSQGKCLGTIKNVQSVTDNLLKGIVEEAPVAE